MKLMFYSYSAYDMVCGIHTYSLARGKLSVGRVANKYLTEPPGLLRTATQHVRALPLALLTQPLRGLLLYKACLLRRPRLRALVEGIVGLRRVPESEWHTCTWPCSFACSSVPFAGQVACPFVAFVPFVGLAFGPSGPFEDQAFGPFEDQASGPFVPFAPFAPWGASFPYPDLVGPTSLGSSSYFDRPYLLDQQFPLLLLV